jgi:hypothetical protein
MNAHEHTDNYGFVFDGYVSIPASGGYTFRESLHKFCIRSLID